MLPLLSCCFFALGLMGAVCFGLQAAETDSVAVDNSAQADQAADETVSTLNSRRGYVFNPPALDERRDVFYDFLSYKSAELKIAQLRRQREAEKRGEAEVVFEETKVLKAPKEDDGSDAAEEFAQRVLIEIRDLFIQEHWEQAIIAADSRLTELDRLAVRYPDSEVLKNAQILVRNYQAQAEEKKIYEEAKRQFESLDLRVEGIMWSGDANSIALLAGYDQPFGVNDRDQNQDWVIVNIDNSRVDFLFVYETRKFHFQRYIESDGPGL